MSCWTSRPPPLSCMRGGIWPPRRMLRPTPMLCLPPSRPLPPPSLPMRRRGPEARTRTRLPCTPAPALHWRAQRPPLTPLRPPTTPPATPGSRLAPRPRAHSQFRQQLRRRLTHPPPRLPSRLHSSSSSFASSISPRRLQPWVGTGRIPPCRPRPRPLPCRMLRMPTPRSTTRRYRMARLRTWLTLRRRRRRSRPCRLTASPTRRPPIRQAALPARSRLSTTPPKWALWCLVGPSRSRTLRRPRPTRQAPIQPCRMQQQRLQPHTRRSRRRRHTRTSTNSPCRTPTRTIRRHRRRSPTPSRRRHTTTRRSRTTTRHRRTIILSSPRRQWLCRRRCPLPRPLQPRCSRRPGPRLGAAAGHTRPWLRMLARLQRRVPTTLAPRGPLRPAACMPCRSRCTRRRLRRSTARSLPVRRPQLPTTPSPCHQAVCTAP